MSEWRKRLWESREETTRREERREAFVRAVAALDREVHHPRTYEALKDE